MTTYRTGNAIGSTDPRDLYDNAENLDELVNSQDKTEHPDRLGVLRKTWHGMEEDFQSFLQSSGYQDLGDYAPGIEITARNQVIRADGELWRLSASVDLPYTTDGSGMPEGGAFVSVGDAALRQELTDPAQGGDLVKVTTSTGEQTLVEALNNRIVYVNNIAELQAISPNLTSDYQHVYVKEYYDGTGYGGGLYINAGSDYSGSDAIEGAGGTKWRMVVNNNIFPIDRLGAIKDDPETVKDAFILAIECVREAGSGTVYVGPGEWSMAGVNYEVNTSNITFHFDLGCHFKMETVLLGWYPTAPGKGHSNVAIVGRGTIEALPGRSWHNDLAYVDGVELRDLTFIRPVVSGHFLDLIGSTNITVDGVTVLGSNIEQPDSPRLFSEFIQVGGDQSTGLGWPAKREEYGPLLNQGIGTTNTTLTNSVFMPYTDSVGVTTYPPRPIGDHGAREGVSNLRIEGNIFKDIIRQDISSRYAWLEMPTLDGVHISNNSFIRTNDSPPETSSHIIGLRGTASSGGVAIHDNVFDITMPDGLYTTCVYNYDTGAVVSVIGNTFKCVAEFSDIVMTTAPCDLRLVDNSVDSTGRRFLFVDNTTGVGSRCLVQGNDLFFNPPTDENYRYPVDGHGSSLNIVGNRIQHPSMAFRAITGGVCTAAGNTMMGGATAVEISNGVLTGNLFNTTTAPVVTIGGSAQTSQGWDFIHVPS